MSKRLVVIAQSVDENDDHRGFFIGWLKEFSRNFDEVSVITVIKGQYTLPPNVQVYSLGKERGVSKLGQALRFYRYLIRLLPGSSGVFAHASPIFIIAAWPLACIYRKRLILWYLHRAVTFKFRLATVLSTWVVTADTRSLGIQSRNIVAVGHGIDADHFTIARDWSARNQSLHLLSVGRLSPIKDFATIIRAVGMLKQSGQPVELRIVGQANTPEHTTYEQELRQLVHQEGLEDSVVFVGAVPYRDMPLQYRWADIVIGATPRGGIDKALLEAMAAGCIVLTSNDIMRRYLEPYADSLLFTHGNAAELADRIAGLPDQEAISTAMVASVRNHHDLSTVIAKISGLL